MWMGRVRPESPMSHTFTRIDYVLEISIYNKYIVRWRCVLYYWIPLRSRSLIVWRFDSHRSDLHYIQSLEIQDFSSVLRPVGMWFTCRSSIWVTKITDLEHISPCPVLNYFGLSLVRCYCRREYNYGRALLSLLYDDRSPILPRYTTHGHSSIICHVTLKLPLPLFPFHSHAGPINLWVVRVFYTHLVSWVSALTPPVYTVM